MNITLCVGLEDFGVGGGELGALAVGDCVGFEATGEDVGGFKVVEGFGGVDPLEDAVDDAAVFDAADFEVRTVDGRFNLVAQVGDDFVAGIFDFDPGGAAFQRELLEGFEDFVQRSGDAAEGWKQGTEISVTVGARPSKSISRTSFCWLASPKPMGMGEPQ